MLISGSTIRPPFGSRASASNIRSTSAGSHTAALIDATERFGAAASTGPRNRSANGALCGLNMSKTRVTQPFGSDRELKAGGAGEIAARMRQVRHEALADRIAHLREHDWHGSALLLQCGRHRRSVGQDQVGLHGEQLRHMVAQPVSVPSPAILDREVASLDLRACAANGHAAVLPSSVMNSRLPM